MVQTGMASPYPTPQFQQNGEALPIKAAESGGGGGGSGQLKEAPVPAYSPPVSAAVAVSGAPVNGIEQQTVSIVSIRPPPRPHRVGRTPAQRSHRNCGVTTRTKSRTLKFFKWSFQKT